VNSKKLNDLQRDFLHINYWGGFYGYRKAIDLFLSMGLSPFMKSYQNKCVIDACINGLQIDTLKYLVEDSYKGNYKNPRYKCAD